MEVRALGFKTVFRRYELKYLITLEQKENIIRSMEEYMRPDEYGRTTIRNLYFDTPSYRLIRVSIERPLYKEKLGVRCYAQASRDSVVFVELKKKFDGVVYKRRVALPEAEAMAWTCGTSHVGDDTQIVREIDYFMSYYGELSPAVFLSYDREAYFSHDGEFRITFDENILSRTADLSLTSPAYGSPILEDGLSLMELKCHGSMPLWMAHILSGRGIFKTPFSKYGNAYRELIFPSLTYKNSFIPEKELSQC